MSQQRQTLAIGQSDFREFRRANAYYVDKSLFIRDIAEDDFQVILLPRPRRFGKTLNLSMLRYFFERSDDHNQQYFQGLAISEHPVCGEHQGKYPVIYLTFKDMKGMDWENLHSRLCKLIAREIERHDYLMKQYDGSQLAHADLQAMLTGTASPAVYEDSLLLLSQQLHRYYQQKVVILIDEYDTPIQAGYANGYYDEIISFMRNLLSGGLKDNPYLFKGVLTGILRVAKESIFSGLNNLGVYTLLAEEFNSAFGFTEQEVKDLLEAYHSSDRYAEVAYWYNGYVFGGRVIYNPWSVINYVSSKAKRPRSYWVNTASTDLIERLFTREGRELREELEQLLEGQTIIKPVYETIVMRDLDRRDQLLWSFLLFSGYLKCTGQVIGKNQYELQIPNEEVRQIYENLIDHWFEDKIDVTRLEEMLTALQNGHIQLFENNLRQIVLEIMSYHDLSGEPEKVYQALVLGMLVWLSSSYTIRTNRESGYGRYDVMLTPTKPDTHTGIILEFKRVADDEKPETVLNNALKQIEERRYAVEMEAAGVTDILRLAVAFRGKELWLKQDDISDETQS